MHKPNSKRCLTPAQWVVRKIEPTDKLLGDLLTTTSRILFSADTGLGKTMVSLAWAFAMGLGRHFLHWKGHRKARILYLDGEMPRDLLQERVVLACQWFGIKPSQAENVSLLSTEDVDMPPLNTEEGQVWLDNFIDDEDGFDFIIFDNLSTLTTGIMKEEESTQAMKPYMQSLTKRRIGHMWIHHTGHDKSRGYGSKVREWQMDTVMVGEQVDRDHVSFNLNFTKARRRKPSNASDFEDVHIELRDGVWVHEPVQPAAVGRPNRSEEIALNALQRAIADGDASESNWRSHAFELGISESTDVNSRRTAFRRAKGALIASGRVIREGDNYAM
jgi:hypothetical protein